MAAEPTPHGLGLGLGRNLGRAWSAEDDQDLVCIDVRQETHDVRTFTFRALEDRHFVFRPGQHFRFEIDLGGEVLSRCYSMSSSALAPRTVSVTVKRVEGGRVSNWLHDHLTPGQRLRAFGPSGDFTLPAEDEHEPLLMLSGGSGITPLMSMLRTLGDARRHPDLIFLHAGRTPDDLIFRDELLFRARMTPQLKVVFLPERPAAVVGHAGITGRISSGLLQALVPDLARRRVLCCGPAPFMAAARALCTALGVPAECYAEESFTGEAPAPEVPQAPGAAPTAADAAVFLLTFARQAREVEARADQTVLAAARQAGVSLPSSCGNGLCGTCKTRLVSGQVDMQHIGGIRQREVQAGFFLPCCSRPRSDLVIER
ncbi:MAG: hypothetical protein RL654_1261 [Pseudomonadota bacterium]|jgi:3-phenylpropionate/trans-cinnamate dioxygenase ferredoxin reductase subunit